MHVCSVYHHAVSLLSKTSDVKSLLLLLLPVAFFHSIVTLLCFYHLCQPHLVPVCRVTKAHCTTLIWTSSCQQVAMPALASRSRPANPGGGHSIWAAAPPLPPTADSSPSQLLTIMLLAPVDSDSLFGSAAVVSIRIKTAAAPHTSACMHGKRLDCSCTYQ